MCCDVVTALRKMEGDTAFDFIFMDPPYEKQLERQVLSYLKDSSLADETTRIIIEASLETAFDYVEILGFEVAREKKYKTNQHIFLRKRRQEKYSDQ